MENRDRYR